MTRVTELIAPKFLPVHADIKTRGHLEYWLEGGRGSTKSSFVATEIVLGLLRDPAASAVVYRKVKNTLRGSVFEEMQKVIGRMGLEGYFSYSVSPLTITYKPTGQKVIFLGADDPAKSKSISISRGYFGFLWFEELAEFGGMEDVRTIIASVIRGEGTDKSIVFYSYNPPRSARNWVNAEERKRPIGRLTHKSTYLDVPKSWLGERFLTVAEQLKESDRRAYEQMYLGVVTGTDSEVFGNLTIRQIPDEEIGTFGETYAGLDFGWYPDPLHFVRCAYQPSRKRLWIFDEYRTVKTTNFDAWEHLRREHGLTGGEEVIADSAENKSIADMRSYGMQCIGATKGRGSVRAGVRWLQELTEIIIDPVRCPAAAKEFSEYEYEKDKDGSPVDALPDKDNHSIDAVRYAMNRVWMRAGE